MGVVTVSREKLIGVLVDMGVKGAVIREGEEVDIVAVARSRLDHGVDRGIINRALAELGLSPNERAAVFGVIDRGGGLEGEEVYELSRDPLVSIRREKRRLEEFKPPEEEY